MIFPFWSKMKSVPAPDAPTLLSLRPKYNLDYHGVYLGAIEAALTGPDSGDIKNIALSGGYGVGKSSILEEVARRHEGTVVSISLSTLGFAEESSETSGVARTASTKTNRIQKEIVKQLLYSQDPVKMPGSRYRRVTRFRFGREFGLAALLAIPVALIFVLAGWSGSLAALVRLPAGWADLINVAIYVAAVFFLMGARKAMHNRIHIDQISTGGTTIALSAQSATFFDEYLDEIVYFFERTNVDLVIFEDIDRFDDAHIFETLRSLNTLLNAAKQLGGRSIRFVYAIKDSIFDELGQRAAQEELDDEDEDGEEEEPAGMVAPVREDDAQIELARANRTKFFDQVIPVVPFVTHLSARNLLKTTLDQIEHNVTNDMVDLVGRHIADMRLIKNVRNEFVIFRERLIVKGSLDLSDNGVLAMILYKSTHLSDFERIKHRRSDLDKFHDDYRDLVNANTHRLNEQIRKTRTARGNLRAGKVWSERLGDRLIEFLDDHVASLQATFVRRGFGDEALTDEQLRSPEVWQRISDGEDIVLTYTLVVQQFGRRVELSSNFSKDQISKTLSDSISSSRWVATERARLDKQIDTALASIAFLRTADMEQLLARPEFTLTQGGTDSLNKLLESQLGSELARQLVRHGYIDQNFTLYTSTFHAVRVSVSAANFMLKNVDRHRMDMAYSLTAKDVEAILRENGRSFLEDKSAFNLSVLDYVLARDRAGADVLVKRLVVNGEDERSLLLSYLAGGGKKEALVRRLAPLWGGVMPFLITEAGIEGNLRTELVDLALNSLSADIDYEGNDAELDFLLSNHTGLNIFTSPDTTADAAALVAQFVIEVGVEIPALEPLGAEMRAAIVERGGYAVTRDNLMLALGDAATLALDAIKARSGAVYKRVLDDLTDYLEALEDGEATISAVGAMVQIITDVLEADEGRLTDVVEGAGDGLQIDDLSSAPVDSWSVLAVDERFPATFENVTAYIDKYGLDEPLGALLTAAEEIEIDEEATEAAKQQLALEILPAHEEIPSPAVRSGLLKSLELEDKISTASVPAEQGELVGRLIGEGIIEDAASSFALIAQDDWRSREYAISRSVEFPNFMTRTDLPPRDIGRVVDSAMIMAPVKRAVVDHLADFVGDSTVPAIRQVADYAISSARGLTIANLTAVSRYIGVDRTLALLRSHLATVTAEDLIPILESLGNEHAKLAGRTGKRPKVTKTDDLEALIVCLRRFDWVSGVDPDGTKVRVRMRRPR